ncbi:tyrosine-type recombinase/integrase [Lachnospiraceae bacterium 29-91]
MAMTAVSYFQEGSIEDLKRQVMECPAKEKRFVKRGIEYLCLHGIYDVLEIEDCLIEEYALWIQQQGVKDKKLIRTYQRTLIDWRHFFRIKEFWGLKEEMEECDSVKPTLKNKAYEFLITQGIHSLQEIDWDIRQLYERYLLGEIHEKETRAWYLRGLDKLKLFDIRKKDQGVKVGRRSLKYEEKKIFLGYHPDYETAEAFSYCRNVEKSVWDFSIKTSGKLKYQVFTILNYALENSSGRELTDGYLAPLNFFYKYSIRKGISDLTVLEQNQIDDYVEETKKLNLVNNRYLQIVEKVQRILFIQAKEINWEANVWYLERFQFDEARYEPSRPVKRLSFLDVSDKKNRGYLKMYIKYQLGVTSSSIQSIWRKSYITKAFLRYLDEAELAVDQLTAAEIDPYIRRLQNEDAEIATFNDKVAEIYSFFRFLTVRGYYKKIPFYLEYYVKRETVPHHYRSVPQNTVTAILKNLSKLPEDMRLMYLHLWCLGLRINEVCTIKREGYYLKEEMAWLRIHQHKMKMEKVIPLPMMLYRAMMVYVERKGILQGAYVFQNSKGGPYLSAHYWHEMVEWCNDLGIRCGDHVFQTHDYRHSVATALYEHGASIQAIREFLGHKHENMTRRYIDCIQEHLDGSSEQYYEEHQSLAKEWKRGNGEDGN